MLAVHGREYAGRPLGALFRLLAVVLLASASQAAAGPAADCAADRIDERVRVVYVHDGDTVRLDDGRRLRLIGFDTPELGRNGAPDQPLARKARGRLDAWVAEGGGWLDLRYDAERRDRYQRTLAHAYLPDGRGVAAAMLADGLATALTVPPNLWALDCNRRAESLARGTVRGLWALPAYQPRTAATLQRGARGFAIVRGRIVALYRTERSVWMRFEGALSLRIDRADAAWFGDLDRYAGRRVEVRGWLVPRGESLQMRVRHPAALTLSGRGR